MRKDLGRGSGGAGRPGWKGRAGHRRGSGPLAGGPPGQVLAAGGCGAASLERRGEQSVQTKNRAVPAALGFPAHPSRRSSCGPRASPPQANPSACRSVVACRFAATGQPCPSGPSGTWAEVRAEPEGRGRARGRGRGWDTCVDGGGRGWRPGL